MDLIVDQKIILNLMSLQVNYKDQVAQSYKKETSLQIQSGDRLFVFDGPGRH